MKYWFQSKTLWFNTLTIVTAIATAYGYTPNDELFSKVAALLVVVNPFVNIALRFMTSKGIFVTKDPDEDALR